MSSAWLKSIGYWHQEEAYETFDAYRRNPTEANRQKAELAVLPIIRVVFSTRKVRATNPFDTDDMMSSAAITLVKALPKMAKKDYDAIGNHKQFTRYLFTCVNHAFYRELDIIHGRHTRVVDSVRDQLEHQGEDALIDASPSFVTKLSLESICENFAPFIEVEARRIIRYSGKNRDACKYIIKQLVNDREISKSILNSLGCKNKRYFVRYCKTLLHLAALTYYKTLVTDK